MFLFECAVRKTLFRGAFQNELARTNPVAFAFEHDGAVRLNEENYGIVVLEG